MFLCLCLFVDSCWWLLEKTVRQGRGKLQHQQYTLKATSQRFGMHWSDIFNLCLRSEVSESAPWHVWLIKFGVCNIFQHIIALFSHYPGRLKLVVLQPRCLRISKHDRVTTSILAAGPRRPQKSAQQIDGWILRCSDWVSAVASHFIRPNSVLPSVLPSLFNTMILTSGPDWLSPGGL